MVFWHGKGEIMRGRFNYIAFFVRIFFCLLFSFLAVGWTVLIVQLCFGDFPGIGEFGRRIVGNILFYYVAFKLGQAAWSQRFTIALTGDKVIVRDVLLFKRRILQFGDIKGFSLMEYPTRWVKGRSIILYLTDGGMIEFPQFLFLNFRKLDIALEESGINFFGVESREWRWKKLE
jgi:hypothetical protein